MVSSALTALVLQKIREGGEASLARLQQEGSGFFSKAISNFPTAGVCEAFKTRNAPRAW
jgi:hypothetical protein